MSRMTLTLGKRNLPVLSSACTATSPEVIVSWRRSAITAFPPALPRIPEFSLL